MQPNEGIFFILRFIDVIDRYVKLKISRTGIQLESMFAALS